MLVAGGLMLMHDKHVRMTSAAGGAQAIGLGSALTAHPHIDPPAPGRSARLALWKWQRCLALPNFLHGCYRVATCRSESVIHYCGGRAACLLPHLSEASSNNDHQDAECAIEVIQFGGSALFDTQQCETPL